MNIVKKISFLVLLIGTMQCIQGSIKQLGTVQEITEQEWMDATDDAYDFGEPVDTTTPSYGKAAQADSITKIYDTLSGKTILTKTTQKVDGFNLITTKQIKTSIATSAWTLQNAGLAIAGVGTALGLGAAAYYGFGKKSDSGTQSAEKSSVPTPISTPSTIQEQSTDVPPVLPSVQSQEPSAGQSEQPVARQPEQNNDTPASDSGSDNQSISSQEKQADKKLVQSTSSLINNVLIGVGALGLAGIGYFSGNNVNSFNFDSYKDSDWEETLLLLNAQSGQSVLNNYDRKIERFQQYLNALLKSNNIEGSNLYKKQLKVLTSNRDKLRSQIDLGKIPLEGLIVAPDIRGRIMPCSANAGAVRVVEPVVEIDWNNDNCFTDLENTNSEFLEGFISKHSNTPGFYDKNDQGQSPFNRIEKLLQRALEKESEKYWAKLRLKTDLAPLISLRNNAHNSTQKSTIESYLFSADHYQESMNKLDDIIKLKQNAMQHANRSSVSGAGASSSSSGKAGVSRASSRKSLPKDFKTSSLEELFQKKLERIKAPNSANSAQSSAIKWVKNKSTGKWEEASSSDGALA